MDPCNSAQDVVRCNLCETPVPLLYCDICHINLCKTCVGDHILDESKLHIVVPVKHRQSIPCYSICSEHTSKLCELHCEQCDIPICVQCVFSKTHKAHDAVDISKFVERKKKALQADLEELGKTIHPKYQEIASTISVQKADLKRNTERLITALNKRGDDWHREIDDVISKLKTDIENTELNHLTFLKKEEDKINHTLSEITQSIVKLKELLDTNDACLLSKYKSRNAEFRRLPPKLIVYLPSLSFQRIDKKHLFQQFGSLSALSITTEARFYTLKAPETNIPYSEILRRYEDDEDDELLKL